MAGARSWYTTKHRFKRLEAGDRCAVEHPVTLTWNDFSALPQTEDTSDFHCVTTWSKLNINWQGVRLLDLAALVQPLEQQRTLCVMVTMITVPMYLWKKRKT